MKHSVLRKIDDAPAIAVNGQVNTKSHIVELMLDLAGYKGDVGVRVLEPGCGEGAFLVPVARRLIRAVGPLLSTFEELSQCVLGVEKDENLALICRMNVEAALVQEGVLKELAKKLAKTWVQVGDFLEGEIDGEFGLVIGNPPYVRQEAIPKEKLEEYRIRFKCFFDRADLYVAFFERGLELLEQGGKLVFICPDRFTKNQYGKKLRKVIADNYSVDTVIDLAQASPFEHEVTCYPGIFAICKGAQAKHVDYYKMTDASSTECQIARTKRSAKTVTYHRYDSWFTGEQKWSIESPHHLDLLRRLEERFVPIGDKESGCIVGIGVATGADSVFIMNGNSREVESSLLMPLATTRDIITGKVKWTGNYVLNPFVGDTNELINLDDFPKAKKYLNAHKEKVAGRNVAKRDKVKWYRTIDRIYPRLQKIPKLLIPDIKAESQIVFEPGELYPHHNLYFVSSETWELQALRTILRSSVGRFFIWMYGVKMRGDFLRFQAQYLRRICIPRKEMLNRKLIKTLVSVGDSEDIGEIDEAVSSVYDLSKSDQKLVQTTSAQREHVND